MALLHLNPDGLHHNPAFSQAIVIPAGARLVVVGGQNAVDASGAIAGLGDLGRQASRAIENVRLALAAAGAGPEHVVRLGIQVVDGLDLREAVGPWLAFWGERPHPPTVNVVQVAGLANPAFLIEIEALAALPPMAS